jgi:hypothetical protein
MIRTELPLGVLFREALTLQARFYLFVHVTSSCEISGFTSGICEVQIF